MSEPTVAQTRELGTPRGTGEIAPEVLDTAPTGKPGNQLRVFVVRVRSDP